MKVVKEDEMYYSPAIGKIVVHCPHCGYVQYTPDNTKFAVVLCQYCDKKFMARY
ncbi:hypothetical protein KAR91_02760 [Candidatus Pacearchaeota archaeon]|nr:hypothetical protein [Candidatus Pacearchaeota archaeon]